MEDRKEDSPVALNGMVYSKVVSCLSGILSALFRGMTTPYVCLQETFHCKCRPRQESLCSDEAQKSSTQDGRHPMQQLQQYRLVVFRPQR